MIQIDQSRLCKDCQAVTGSKECPICGDRTVVHPERRQKRSYCVDCGGEFPVSGLLVRAFEDDPYCQTGDGMLITVCRECDAVAQAEDDDQTDETTIATGENQ